MKKLMFGVFLTIGGAVFAQQGGDGFLRQQAYAEMQKVTGQIDVLQTNFTDLQNRVGRLEGNSDAQNLKHDIEALRQSIDTLRSDMNNQRAEIVKDLTARFEKMMKDQGGSKAAVTSGNKSETKSIGKHREYIVQSGETLSLISEASGVPLKKILEMNNLKKDSIIRVGQKIILPL